MPELHLLLASGSPRRRELLGWLGLRLTIRPADVDETPLPGEAPAAYVQRLAQEKARAAHARADGLPVLAADTTVADGGFILGKPLDAADAAGMLRRLRGRTHHVHTALALLLPGGQLFAELCSSPVRMRPYSEEEMLAYVASGDPLDKAGAYAIQNRSFQPVENFTGCTASVMGLPLCHLARSLRRAGLDAPQGISGVCRARLHYDCPVSGRILAGEDTG